MFPVEHDRVVKVYNSTKLGPRTIRNVQMWNGLGRLWDQTEFRLRTSEGIYLLHREDGPAIVVTEDTSANAPDLPEEWWLWGRRYAPFAKADVGMIYRIESGEYPFEDLPLLINHPLFRQIALGKLGGEDDMKKVEWAIPRHKTPVKPPYPSILARIGKFLKPRLNP